MSRANDLVFLQDVLGQLRAAGIQTWVFGGWAEELRGLRPSGQHRDIDLLYPNENFVELDRYLAEAHLDEVRAKRFSHKRAFVLDGILIELILVQEQGGRRRTRFFDGLCCLEWPEDTFEEGLVGGTPLPVVSAQALVFYRAQHHRVEQAYRASRE